MAFYNSINDYSNFVISFTDHPEQDFGIFARSYAQAAAVLAEHLLKDGISSDADAYPVVFLYRQAFELYLKAFFYKAKRIFLAYDSAGAEDPMLRRHRLVPLAETFQKVCHRLFSSDGALLELADEAHARATEFEQIDRDSFGYRYPIDTRSNPSTSAHQIVNLRALHNSMKDLLDKLNAAHFEFEDEADQAEYTREITAMILETLNTAATEKDETA